MNIEHRFPLARLTTIGTGGPARAFARPRSVAELEDALSYAAAEGLDVVVVGLGSNLLAADDGVDALVLRLEGELAAAEVVDTGLVAGGGATNAVCLHRARAAGLGGFEFACAIPGTAGGGVKMNAGAYGSDWSNVLAYALVASAEGTEELTPAELGLSYRHSDLHPGQVVARVAYRLTPRPPEEIKATVSELAPQGHAADEQAHLRERFQEPAGRARRRPDARAVRAERASRGWRPDLAQARELRRECRRRDERRLSRRHGRGAKACARAVRRRARA
jgi:UDP-N-acetylmuramate dehydrogenase